MVGGNWQRRVERAQVRRERGKQLKQRKEQRSLNKALVAASWPLIDQFNIQILEENQIDRVHIWVDHQPCSQQNGNDNADDLDIDRKVKRSNKKVSNNISTENNGTSKKSHPRSHEPQLFDESLDDESMLCRSFFFTGECDGFKQDGKSKKGCYVCDLIHFSKPQRTLFDILSSKQAGKLPVDLSEFLSSQLLTLQTASKAAALAQISLEDQDLVLNEISAVDTVYHIEVPLTRTNSNDFHLSHLISSSLVKEKVPSGSINYLALGNMLIFDRYNGGFIRSNYLTSRIQSQNDVASLPEEINGGGCNLIVHFPSTILEMILSFLPDKYSGKLPSVCKNWLQEIGHHSPNLWRNFNLRNGWPNPNECDLQGKQPDVSAKMHKSMFALNHITCMRMKRLLIGSSSNGLLNSAFDDVFNAAHSLLSKPETNAIVDMKFFSECSILLGTQNGAIYMVQVSPQDDKLVSKTFGPIRIVPKTTSRHRSAYKLQKIIIDDKYVLLSFKLDSISGILLSIAKDDFLKYSSETVINCGPDESLIYCDLSAGFRDFCSQNTDLDELREYIETYKENTIHTELQDHNIIPCGYGIFTAVVHYYTQDETGLERTTHGFGLISFSVISKGISVIDYCRLEPLRPYISNLSLVSNWETKKKSELSMLICNETRQRFVVDKRGCISSQNLFSEQGGNILRNRMLLTSSFVLSANLLPAFMEASESVLEIRLETLAEENRESSYLLLPRYYCDITSMIFVGLNHILVVCERSIERGNQIIANHGCDMFIHLFQSDHCEADSQHFIKYDFVIIQVPELHITSVECATFPKDSSILIDSIPKYGTSAATFNGFINVVGIQTEFFQAENNFEDKSQTKSKKEKKKKRLSSKNEKKDAFARGMSFR